MGTRKYKKFNRTAPFTTLKRIIFTTFVGCPVLCGIVLCPSHGIHWSVKLLFKVVIPLTLGNFYLFGVSKWVALQFNLINTSTVSSPDSEATQSTEEEDANNTQQKLLPEKKAN